MKRTALILPLASLTLATACMTEDDLGTEALPVIGGDGEECPKWGCSSNSAFIGPTEFHELDETGVTPNAEGFRITSFTKNGVSYRLDVTGTTMVGKQFLWGWGWITTLSGQNLVGAEMAVDGNNGEKYIITVYNASTVQDLWQGPAGLVNTYELRWRQVFPSVTHYVPVCKDPPNRIDGEGKEWKSIYEAIVFTGDRYDADHLTVTQTTPAGSGPWFNIGCAGTVLAKLALNRHTDATQVPGAATTWAQRQTMLKMYTSDVCGTGDAFTKSGTPIRWWSTAGWSSPAIPLNSIEARWDAYGATCLDTHRLHGTFDEMDAQIFSTCSLNRISLLPCTRSSDPYYLRTSSQAIP
jgi:hypothetical protein